MAETARSEDIEALLGEHPGELQRIERRLRERLLDAMPEGRETVDMGSKLLAYSLGTRMQDLCFAIIAHKSHVNLQLADGADLPDPDGMVEGTGKRVRHVKLRSVEDADRPAVARLIAAQLSRRSGG